jgi:uncharacterized small protein (DUF1192 family)
MTKLSPLYALASDYKQLLKLADSDEVSAEAVEETLKSIEGQFNEKAQAVLIVANSFDHHVAMLDAEIARLKSLKDSYTSKQASLKEYLRVNMERTEISKIQCDLFSITLRKGSPVVNVIDESALPDDYVTVKTVVSPDKRAIGAALKAGEEIPGAELVTGKSSILIK